METNKKIYTIDANGKILGRLAVKIAILLRGKEKSNFMPNKDGGSFVIVNNVDKIVLTGKKKEKKIYYHHSGYPGGIKAVSFNKIFENNPKEILKKAVFGMLPKNKLRAKQIKRLKIS